MIWTLRIADRAAKQLARLPTKDRQRVAAALRAMRSDTFGGDIQRLRGQESTWRRRVGGYRIVYDLDLEHGTMDVLDIVRRTSTTY